MENQYYVIHHPITGLLVYTEIVDFDYLERINELIEIVKIKSEAPKKVKFSAENENNI